MADLGEYSLTRALLIQLCGLESTDAELPLTILINLHRVQLQQPLEVMAERVAKQRALTFWATKRQLLLHEAVQLVEADLETRYPALAQGKLYMESPRAILAKLGHLGLERAERLRPSFSGKVSILDELVRKAGGLWVVYEPLVQLYACASKPPLRYDVQMLELQLGLDPQVGLLILDLAEDIKTRSSV